MILQTTDIETVLKRGIPEGLHPHIQAMSGDFWMLVERFEPLNDRVVRCYVKKQVLSRVVRRYSAIVILTDRELLTEEDLQL